MALLIYLCLRHFPLKCRMLLKCLAIAVGDFFEVQNALEMLALVPAVLAEGISETADVGTKWQIWSPDTVSWFKTLDLCAVIFRV